MIRLLPSWRLSREHRTGARLQATSGLCLAVLTGAFGWQLPEVQRKPRPRSQEVSGVLRCGPHLMRPDTAPAFSHRYSSSHSSWLVAREPTTRRPGYNSFSLQQREPTSCSSRATGPTTGARAGGGSLWDKDFGRASRPRRRDVRADEGWARSKQPARARLR
jgi:hypothetical protein